MDAQPPPRRGADDGRVGRDGYGDVQRLVRRGTQRKSRTISLNFQKLSLPESKHFSDRFIFLSFPHQLDLHNNNLDIREPSVHTQARTWVTDYFVGCHASEEGSGLSVIVGSNEHVFFYSLSFTPYHSCTSLSPLKGRRRAAQERGLPRSRIELVFRAVMDRSSQRRRAISTSR
jgi:hypothetical protein